jgi:hypothetical protein
MRLAATVLLIVVGGTVAIVCRSCTPPARFPEAAAMPPGWSAADTCDYLKLTIFGESGRGVIIVHFLRDDGKVFVGDEADKPLVEDPWMTGLVSPQVGEFFALARRVAAEVTPGTYYGDAAETHVNCRLDVRQAGVRYTYVSSNDLRDGPEAPPVLLDLMGRMSGLSKW